MAVSSHPFLGQFSRSIHALVAGFILTFNKDREKFEVALAQLTLHLLNDLRNGIRSAKEVDNIFTALFVGLSDFVEFESAGSEVGDVLIEGMSIHDIGRPWGADLEFMSKWSARILRKHGRG